MCGIIGGFGPPHSRAEWLPQACDVLRHRGPDDAGVWFDAEAGVAFGHRRLAILDLSAAGRQPMESPCGRYRMVFNGEIYNHLELRDALSPRPWRGRSDTETLLACFADWGIERALKATVGMFGLAVFDVRERRLILARDRFGEKPLYYGYVAGAFVFASELKALRAIPGFDATLDRGALAEYMRLSYVPAPRSIYLSMRKLPPACWLELTPSDVASGSLPDPRRYWSASEVALAGDRAPTAGLDDADAIDLLEDVLRTAVRGQMLADVPIGAFLSGGIDSSTVAALMQAQSSSSVRTFSIGFAEGDFDESRQARLVAEHLGTDHAELTVQAGDVLALVPRIASAYDEPFADPSQLPTFFLMQMARRHVTVALSGDGGDELFGGYNRHFLGARLWPRLARLPWHLRRTLAGGLRAVSPAALERFGALAAPLVPARYRVRMLGDKLLKTAELLECRDDRELYRRLVNCPRADELVLEGGSLQADFEHPWPDMSSLAHQMMVLDAVGYLPDDILVKVDRAAMAVSLETRLPMLDHRVYEFAWSLPLHMKLREGIGKWILRQLLHRYVPAPLVDRPKMGFAAPIGDWLRGPLRDWAEQLLAAPRLRREAYLDAALVRRRWQEHLSGRYDRQYQLWNILMFQTWLETA